MKKCSSSSPRPSSSFLLHTSILDRLCGPLCDAVLGDPIGSGQAALHAIERANLFLVPLDVERHWYRYHHLFGEFLRQRLMQDASLAGGDVARLHTRASIWYEAQGLDLEALHHAAAAADSARLAGLAERLWERMDSSFQSVAWRRWVRQLPEAVLRARPVLCIQYAWALLDAGEVEASEARLRDAERAMASLGDSAIVQDGAAEPIVVVVKEQLGSSASADRSCPRLPGPDPGRFRGGGAARCPCPRERRRCGAVVARPGRGVGRVRPLGQWRAGGGLPGHADWIEHTRQAGNLAFALASVFYLAEIRLAQGQLREAARIYRQFLQLVPPDDEAIRQAAPHLHLGLALVAHEQGDAQAAALHLQASKERGERASLIDWPFRWSVAQARIQESAGAWEAALDLLDAADAAVCQKPRPRYSPSRSDQSADIHQAGRPHRRFGMGGRAWPFDQQTI